jgi:hypothetical protein
VKKQIVDELQMTLLLGELEEPEQILRVLYEHAKKETSVQWRNTAAALEVALAKLEELNAAPPRPAEAGMQG